MEKPVKARTYNASRRREAAARTRALILESARLRFLADGYSATTMAAIAEGAGVAVDTIYESIGRKPALFRLLIEAAIADRGDDATEAVPALERHYVRAMQQEGDPREKLHIYAAATRRIHSRLAPLIQVLNQAAASDVELGNLWDEIATRRARNMRMLATELMSTGEVRPELTLDEVADIIWATNSPEFYLLLVEQRGWSPSRYEAWLADAWQRLLLV